MFSYKSFWARGSSMYSVKNKGGMSVCIGDPNPVELRLYSRFFVWNRLLKNRISKTVNRKHANIAIEMMIMMTGLILMIMIIFNSIFFYFYSKIERMEDYQNF